MWILWRSGTPNQGVSQELQESRQEEGRGWQRGEHGRLVTVLHKPGDLLDPFHRMCAICVHIVRLCCTTHARTLFTRRLFRLAFYLYDRFDGVSLWYVLPDHAQRLLKLKRGGLMIEPPNSFVIVFVQHEHLPHLDELAVACQIDVWSVSDTPAGIGWA